MIKVIYFPTSRSVNFVDDAGRMAGAVIDQQCGEDFVVAAKIRGEVKEWRFSGFGLGDLVPDEECKSICEEIEKELNDWSESIRFAVLVVEQFDGEEGEKCNTIFFPFSDLPDGETGWVAFRNSHNGYYHHGVWWLKRPDDWGEEVKEWSI